MSTRMLIDLRHALGLSYRVMAKELGCRFETLWRIEKGLSLPSALLIRQVTLLMRRKRLTIGTSANIPTHRVDPIRMDLCLNKPGSQWLKWNGQQRGVYLAHRSRYRKILAEVEAGRAQLVPRIEYPRNKRSPQARLIRALDAAPSYDCY